MKSKITFDYEQMHYTLEFTAASLKKAEKMKLLQFGKIEETVLNAPEDMFKAAFLANHPTVSDAEKHKIFLALTRRADGEEDNGDDDTDGLVDALVDMINEAVDEITGRGKQGNVKWKVVN